MSPSPCPVCALEAQRLASVGFVCLRCGEFVAPPGFAPPAALRSRLSCWLRETFDRTGVAVDLRGVDLETTLVAAVPPRSVEEAVDRLLLAVHARAPELGTLTPHEPVAAWAARGWLPGSPALLAILRHLRFGALFEQAVRIPHPEEVADELPVQLGLTVDGVLRVEALGAGADSVHAFLAYAYQDDVRASFVPGAEAALVATGFTPYRVEGEHTDERITDRMVVMLRRSRLLVCDLTHARPNVLWEAGFMHGLGRGVIYTVRDGEAQVPFDVGTWQHVRYADTGDLERRLADRIRALGWALRDPQGPG